MQLRQIEIFLEVVRQKSFSKAAESLYLSQPTVSSHIRALEESLNTRLLVRSTRELTLTPEGRLFYSYASQIMGFCRRAEADLSRIGDEKRSRLVVSASSVPAQYFLPGQIRILREKYPGLCVRILSGDSSRAVKDVGDGTAELGITGRKEEAEGLVFKPLFREKLVIITPNEPFFAGLSGTISQEVVRKYPFVMREEGSGTRSATEELLAPGGAGEAHLEAAVETGSTEGVIRCVENGVGISIVSKLAADYYLPYGKILSFEMEGMSLKREFYAVYRDSVPLSEPAGVLLGLLSKLADRLA